MRKRMSYNDFPVKMTINNENEIDEYNDYLEDKESLNNMQKRLTILYNEKKSNQILSNHVELCIAKGFLCQLVRRFFEHCNLPLAYSTYVR